MKVNNKLLSGSGCLDKKRNVNMHKNTIAGFISVKVFLVLITVMHLAVSPPVHPNDVDSDNQNKGNISDWDLGLPYEKYLQEVIRVLEEDDEFKGKLERAKQEDITSGKISEDLQFVNHRVRTQLDELKRVELDRLRRTLKEQAELSKGADGKGRGSSRRHNLPGHVDAMNPHTFEVEDLKKLVIQTTKDLDEVDRRRREEFKVYEMEKEHLRRTSLEKLDEENRKRAENEYEEQQKKHKEHPKLHHPGSKQQLEEVWEEADDMPVEEFEPRTFHKLHDMNGDGFWDDDELNAVFIKELNKMYDSKNPEDDIHERYEEMNRMREHVKNETDVNHDGMISVDELIDMTKRRDFEEDPGWRGIDEQQQFSEQEFQEYERHRINAQQQFQQQQFQQPPPHPGQLPNHGYPIDPQQFHGQPNIHIGEGYQQHPQGYQQQPMVYQQQAQEYQHQQGYQQPPQGFQRPPQGHQQPPQGYQQPPNGYQQPPQGYQQPPHVYQPPPQVYQQSGYPQQPPIQTVQKQQRINGDQQQPQIHTGQPQPVPSDQGQQKVSIGEQQKPSNEHFNPIGIQEHKSDNLQQHLNKTVQKSEDQSNVEILPS